MPKYIYKKTDKGTEKVGILPSLEEWDGKVNKSGDTMTGNLTPATNKGASLGTSSLYWRNIYGTTIYENGTSLADKYASKTNIPEAYLTWGGKNFSGTYGPIDASMIPDLGANRLAFMPPAGISVEYSRDSGTTWQDYGATDAQKLGLTSTRANFIIGKADSSNKATERYMLRISLHTSDGKVYTQLNKFALYVSTSGSNGSYCTIRARTQNNYLNKVDKWDVFANKQSIAGWSGWNIINTSTITTYGNTASSQYGEIQFIFGCTSGSTSYVGLQIQRLMGFGGVGWQTPSNMAKYGTIYSYDYNQGVAFPGALTANGTVNVSSGDLKLSSSGTIWCSQFNDASGISLRNSRGGATQIGTSRRDMHLCSGTQPEWWMNGAKKDTIAVKSDLKTKYKQLDVTYTGRSVDTVNFLEYNDDDYSIHIGGTTQRLELSLDKTTKEIEKVIY